MTPLEALQAARQLIEKPEHWTRGTCARNALGHAVKSDSEEAVSFCAIGAILRASDERNYPAYRAWTTLDLLTDSCASEFNDTHTHAEVLDLFDRAIKDLSRDAT